MEENEDHRQFFRDLAATAEQTLEDVRGFEENYYSLVTSAFPWTVNAARSLQNYIEQDFSAAFLFARELSQAKDWDDFVRVHSEYLQQGLQLFFAQAKDFADSTSVARPQPA